MPLMHGKLLLSGREGALGCYQTSPQSYIINFGHFLLLFDGLVLTISAVTKLFNNKKSTKGVILSVIFGDAHQFMDHFLIPLIPDFYKHLEQA